MAVALLGITLWAYLGVRDTLTAQLDRSLAAVFKRESYLFEESGRLLLTTRPRDLDAFVVEINRLVVLRDSAGRVIQANNDLVRDLPLNARALGRALAGEHVVVEGRWRTERVRSLYGPARGGAVLQVAASRRHLDKSSQGVLLRMVITALLGSMATMIGAAWLARSALAPVEDIATQARTIQGTRRGERITVHAQVSELQGLVEVLNRMLERIERASEWHRRIIRDLGHDLRTPITAMGAEVEMALRKPRTAEEYRRVLASTQEEVERLGLIGDALSLLGRLEAGDLAPVIRQVDVRQVAGEAVDRVRARLGAQPVSCVCPPSPVPANLDGHLIGLALDQLLDNARRHTPAGTPVEVTVSGADGWVRLVVEDRGPGVPEETLPHLFDRFYRGTDARERTAGPGLGLTVAATIVDLHRGGITARLGEAGGLRVEMALPADAG